jgi:hypothetical protein
MDEKTYMEVLLISGISSLKATITEFRVTGNESMETLKTTSNIVNSSYWGKDKNHQEYKLRDGRSPCCTRNNRNAGMC